MAHRHLILRLEAPLMSFGGTMIDAIGPTLETPLKSMITGLLANALGWHRGERARHRDLQDRTIMGVRLDRTGTELFDFQTAQLGKNDEGWTTRGVPEGRAGGPDTYKSPHIRRRFYRADAYATVAVRLSAPQDPPTLDDVAHALRSPARPLFLGRKPCLPARPIFTGEIIDADNVFGALERAAIVEGSLKPNWRKGEADRVRLAIPHGEGRPESVPHRTEAVADVRDWMAGVHAGESRLDMFSLPRAAFPLMAPGALP